MPEVRASAHWLGTNCGHQEENTSCPGWDMVWELESEASRRSRDGHVLEGRAPAGTPLIGEGLAECQDRLQVSGS